MDHSGQSDSLGSFLRHRRYRITREQAGLPAFRRRPAAKHLSMDDVARLAGIVPSWYSSIERGTARPSNDVLAAIARALKLTTDDAAYMHKLAEVEMVFSTIRPDPTISDVTKSFLYGQDRLPAPAYVMDACWNILAWNNTASACFMDFSRIPEDKLNTVWLMFAPSPWCLREFIDDWEGHAQRVLAQFRSDSATYVRHRQYIDLTTELKEKSPEFRKWWPDAAVQGKREGDKDILHPRAGRLKLVQTTMLSSDQGMRFVFYLARDAETREKITNLLRDFEYGSQAA